MSRSSAWLVACFSGVSCLGGHRATPDAARLASGDRFDTSAYSSPAGESLAFGVREGIIRNYFVRRGAVAAHVLLRSGQGPRLIAAFPANNQGIGVWFTPSAQGAELSLGAAPDVDPNPRGGELTPLVRDPALDEKTMRGVRATLTSSATEASLGIADAAAALEPVAGETIIEYGIALDANLRPLPVMHSDHGFVLAFLDPTEAYLDHVAGLLQRPFPAGLMSPAGVMVANPALAEPTFEVQSSKVSSDANDDEVLLRDLFTPAHYHGAVVWSWQQALLAKGLRRQLARADLSSAARARLETAECALWHAIDRTRAFGTRELWSWAPDAAGQPEPRPFGADRADADESNAIQLWSTVYLSVQEPTPAQNPRCKVSAEGSTGVTP